MDESLKQEWMTRGIVDEHGLNPHVRITVAEREQIIALLTAHEQAWVKVLNKIASEYAQDMIVAQVELDAEREKKRILSDALIQISENDTIGSFEACDIAMNALAIADAKTDRASA